MKQVAQSLKRVKGRTTNSLVAPDEKKPAQKSILYES